MKILKSLVVIGLLYSCSSTHVTRPAKSEYAPKDYKPIGMIKYLNQGADFVIKQRREDAFEEMHEACAGEYKIVSEGNKNEGAMITPGLGNSLMVFDSEYWYITYECTN